jgi:gamma-glutamyltranspeptidase / glutathione hydrolase
LLSGCMVLLAAAICCGEPDDGGPAIKPARGKAPANPAASADKWHDTGRHGAVAAGGSEAVDAGLDVLRAGGNAADAAVATLLALSVTDSNMFCFGGELSLLIYDAKQQRIDFVCGQGAAPLLATRELFAAGGGIPATGVRAATVPAVLDACTTVLDRYGTLSFAAAARPAIGLLDRHRKVWHSDLARSLHRLIEAEQAGDGDRAAGLRRVADYFYRGPLAHEIGAWSEANGGLLRAADLAAHKTLVEPPVSVDYRDVRVYKCGPGTQGPCLLEALQMLAGFDLAAMGQNSPDAIHTTVEALKLALADRDVYYGDPAFVDVPVAELLAPQYAAERRKLIDPKHASREQRPGDPRAGKPLLDRVAAQRGLGNPHHDTTTCLVADSQGNVVAATPSGWSGVLVGATGVWLGSRLQSFNTWEGHPNCIAPGKRPRITLSPTLVTRQEKPVLAVSVAGADGQDQAGLQMVIDAVDFHLSPTDSVTAVRFGTNHFVSSFGQAPPELASLLIYSKVGPRTIAELKSRGHDVKIRVPPLWNPSVLAIDPVSGQVEAAGDPQAGRHAAAY